ncbi:SAV_2336 N-terminal domain-related protein [Plantactinospora sp. WMMB782]|uniref:SAV_2336 N-terminal domain-related protein n=1 Tax=Plantactinospora sp. WMMB782 TaxID=3404121 RepID=UPI003B94E4F0
MTAERLRRVISAVGGEPTARELAETLWLARQLAGDRRPPGRETGPEPAPGALPAPVDPPDDGSVEPEELPAPPGRSPLDAVTVDETALHSRPAGPERPTPGVPDDPDPPGSSAVEARVPQTAALPDRRDFQRALRPLMRRVPSSRMDVLDEEATARFVADHPGTGRTWPPVLRPSTQRWLDAAVVVDCTDSMAIWRQLATEVTDSFAGSGAFHRITSWRLTSVDRGRRAVVSTWTGEERSPAELVNPNGRRVVFVLSDCVDRMWHLGAAGSLLHRWGRHGPVTILQPLPERLWARTGARTIPGRLALPRPGAPNTDLRFTSFDRMRVPPGTLMPVLEISGDWLARWTGMLAGSAPVTSAVTVVTEHRVDRMVPRTSSTPSPLQRVRYFRSVASPQAFRLAAYVAMSEPHLPVIRHIHQSMFRPALPAHLAEVLLSGLLRVVDGGAGHYQFVDGVQRHLLDSLTRPEVSRAGELLERISQSVQARMSLARDRFTALTPGAGEQVIGADSVPFAVISSIGRDCLDRSRNPLRSPVAPPPETESDRTAGRAGGARAEPPGAGPEAGAGVEGGTAGAVPPVDDLLAPERAVVRFHGRAAEIADLERWCTGDGPAVRLVTGPVGRGKTRLALELVGRLLRAGWRTFLLPRDRVADAAGAWRSYPDGVLVVADRAEAFPEAVLDLAGHGTVPGARVRLLVLARSAGDWWRELCRRDGSGLLRQAQVEVLPPFPTDPAGRGDAFRQAVRDLAGALPTTGPAQHPGEPDLRLAVPDLRHDRFGSPLNLHLLALRLLLAELAPDTSAAILGGVVREVLGRERQYWERTAIAAQISYPSPALLDGLVAAAALYGASSAVQAHEVVRRSRPAAGTDQATVHRLATWLHELYPGGPGRYWGPVEPEAVRQRLVLSAVLGDRTLVSNALPHLDPEQGERALALLGPACAGYPELAEDVWTAAVTRPAWVTSLLRETRQRLPAVPPALLARVRAPLRDPNTPLALLHAIADGLDDDAAVFAGQRPRAAAELVAGYRRLAEATYRHLPRLADALHQQRECLRGFGRDREALDPVAEEVELRGRIVDSAGTRVSPAALAALAASLDAQTDLLIRAGMSVQALRAATRAVDQYRRLDTAWPNRYLPEMVAALTVHARLASGVGRLAEAADSAAAAVEASRHLVGSGGQRYEEDLAAALGVLASVHRARGDRDAAVDASSEAVAAYRLLAGRDPARSWPMLARALVQHASDLGELGSPQLSLPVLAEAVAILGDLATDSTGEFLPELATAHHLEAVHLRDLERHEHSLAALARTIDLYRRLAAADPGTYRITLAVTLSHQATELTETGRIASALEVLTESCAILGDLHAEDPANRRTRSLLINVHGDLARLWEWFDDAEQARRHRLEAQLLLDGPDQDGTDGAAG